MEFNGKTMTAYAQFTSSEAVQEIFIAEYGVTTLEEMEEAYNAGRMLFCREGANYAPLYQKTAAGSFAFYSHNSTTQTNRYCTANEGWQRKDTGLCDTKHKEFESQMQALEERIAKLESASGGD